MLKVFSDGSKHVLVLQETKFTDTELRAYLKTAQIEGWNVYHQEGPPTITVLGTQRENGGVLVVVKKELRQKLLKKITKARSQMVIVMVHLLFPVMAKKILV